MKHKCHHDPNFLIDWPDLDSFMFDLFILPMNTNQDAHFWVVPSCLSCSQTRFRPLRANV